MQTLLALLRTPRADSHVLVFQAFASSLARVIQRRSGTARVRLVND